MTTPPLWKWLVAGLLATLTMDLTSTLLRKLGLVTGVAPPLVGRWFSYLARGQFSHHTIAQTPPVGGELPVALMGHYLIGISLTVLFWALVFKAPVPLAGAAQAAAFALAFGALTNALPWLWMFPSMGFGFFGLDGPAEAHLLRSSFLNHLCFGAGLVWVTRVFGGVA